MKPELQQALARIRGAIYTVDAEDEAALSTIAAALGELETLRGSLVNAQTRLLALDKPRPVVKEPAPPVSQERQSDPPPSPVAEPECHCGHPRSEHNAQGRCAWVSSRKSRLNGVELETEAVKP